MQWKTRCRQIPLQTEAVMKDCRQSENVCDCLSLHEAAFDFSHYVMPTQSNKKLLFLQKMENSVKQ